MANDTQKKFEVNDLIERGKSKGSLSNAEILEFMEQSDCDIEQMEKIYEQIESNGIEITGFDVVDLDDLGDIDSLTQGEDVEEADSGEDVDKILSQEGLAIDDPVRMYLKEICKIPLLSAEK